MVYVHFCLPVCTCVYETTRVVRIIDHSRDTVLSKTTGLPVPGAVHDRLVESPSSKTTLSDPEVTRQTFDSYILTVPPLHSMRNGTTTDGQAQDRG